MRIIDENFTFQYNPDRFEWTFVCGKKAFLEFREYTFLQNSKTEDKKLTEQGRTADLTIFRACSNFCPERKNEENCTAYKSAIEKIKRKRGRPKSSKPIETHDDQPKKGRGRPKKINAPQNRRGRPKKSV